MVLVVGEEGGAVGTVDPETGEFISTILTYPESIYTPPLVEVEPIKQTFITVDGIEYETTGLTSMQLLVLKSLKLTYENFSESARKAMPFDIYVYKMMKAKIFERMYEEMEEIIEEVEELDIDPESYEFKFRLWLSDLRMKLKMFKESTAFFTPIVIILAIVIIGLILYVSMPLLIPLLMGFLTEKGKKLAK